MKTLADIRQQYPQYENKSDEELANALHAKFYSKIPREQFYSQIGFNPEQIDMEKKGWPGVGSDLLDKVVETAVNIPNALLSAPEEISGAFGQMFGGERPQQSTEQQLSGESALSEGQKRALRNIAAGGAQFAHSASQAPGNLRDYMIRKGIWSEKLPSLRPPGIPKEYNAAESFGLGEQQPGDALLQGIPNMALTAGIGKAISPLLAEIPITKKLAARPLEKTRRGAYKRGVTNIPVSEELLAQAEARLPNTPEVKQLIEDARKGDYNAVFGLQSDLGAEARGLAKSSTHAERRQAQEVHSLKQQVLGSIKAQLEKEGHNDLAKLLMKGQKKYRQYKWLDQNIYPYLKKYGIPTSVGGAVYKLLSSGRAEAD